MGWHRDDGSTDEDEIGCEPGPVEKPFVCICNDFVRSAEFGTNLQTIRSVLMSNVAEGTETTSEALCRHHGRKAT